MSNYYNQIIELKASIPESYSEENLNHLEKMVTQYHQLLQSVAEDDEDNKTQFYLERIDTLESYLRNAKFGVSEKQRMASFIYAKDALLEGIQALLNNINRANGKEDVIE